MPSFAQDGLGPGRRPKRPDICFNADELDAEAVLRAGLVLRAFARDCARRGIDGSILPRWAAFDAANADALRAAVQLRNDAYARNYPDDAYAGQRVVDDLLTSRGITHPSAQECLAVAEVVNGFEVWEDFLGHARRTELGQIKMQIKTCPKGRRGR